MNAHQARRPAGTPTGGRFAGTSRPEPGYSLGPDPAADAAIPSPVVRAGRREMGPATVDGRAVTPETVVLSDGTRVERYYRDGRLHDPDDGHPAVVWLGDDGTVESVEHWRHGEQVD